MILNYTNIEQSVNHDLSMHDNVLEEFIFYREEKRLHLLVAEAWESGYEKHWSIDFKDVIGFYMTSCDFWGESSRMNDWIYYDEKNATIIPKVFDVKEKNDYSFCRLKEREQYFEVDFEFISGDHLRIACEQIEMILE